jgi:hypothetical protein
MAFKNGPLISPAMFRQFLVPAYRRVTGLLRDFGIDAIRRPEAHVGRSF